MCVLLIAYLYAKIGAGLIWKYILRLFRIYDSCLDRLGRNEEGKLTSTLFEGTNPELVWCE